MLREIQGQERFNEILITAFVSPSEVSDHHKWYFSMLSIPLNWGNNRILLGPDFLKAFKL